MASRETSEQAHLKTDPAFSTLAEPAVRHEFGTATNLENVAVQLGGVFGRCTCYYWLTSPIDFIFYLLPYSSLFGLDCKAFCAPIPATSHSSLSPSTGTIACLVYWSFWFTKFDVGAKLAALIEFYY